MAEGTQSIEDELPVFNGIGSGLSMVHFSMAILEQQRHTGGAKIGGEATKSQPSSKQEIRATSTEIQGKIKAEVDADSKSIDQQRTTSSPEIQEIKEVERDAEIDSPTKSITKTDQESTIAVLVKEKPDSYQEEQDCHRENGGIPHSVGTDSISIEKANTSGDWSTDKNGVEDDAVLKRKVEPPDLEVTDVDAKWRSSDRRRGSGAGDSRKIDGGFRRLCPVVLRPPPLMAAVFTWDRGKGPHGTSGEGRAATTAGRLRSLDNDRGQDVGSRGAEYAEYGVVKEEKQRTVTTLDNGAAKVEGGSAMATSGGSDYAGVLHGNVVAKGDGEPLQRLALPCFSNSG
ncbi:hypothetical protein PIB30_069657 [Stylosanthes scabra]|uniref:Uncharacterized protein n=1 Tax=Stylosanthes scabra TaxID=79078 RepID=A0ABU6YM79_9FABA|nr:hypothetical protein [Stylosanthes scabra]